MAKLKRPATVGSRIEEARIRYGLSQAQLGVHLKVTRAAVSQYEKDQITPRNRVIDRLAEVFGASPEWFTHGRGDQPKPSDLPVSIPEINLDLIISRDTTETYWRGLRTGRQWTLPSSVFDGAITLNHDQLVTFAAPNHVAPVHLGDRVVVDLQQRTCGEADQGVFLVYVGEPQRVRLSHCQRHAVADILGRVVGVFRMI